IDLTPAGTRWHAGTGQQDEPARPLLDHPPRHEEAEAAEASRDEIGAVRTPAQGECSGGGRPPHEARHVSNAAAPRHLIFAIACEQAGREVVGGGFGRCGRIEIYEAAPERGVLTRDRAAETP